MMRPGAILVSILGGLAGAALLDVMLRWRLRRGVARALEKARRDGAPELEPESRFIVRVDAEEVACERPDGVVDRLRWDKLRRVRILTTSDGPLAPDVFWLLEGSSGGCMIPQGATGEKRLLQRLQALPGFDNEAVIDAMGCTNRRRFLCWEKKA